MAMLTSAVDVSRPPEEVFAYVTDPEKFGEWQANVVSGHQEGSGAPKAGTLCLTTRRIGFAERTVTSEVTHYEPPSRWGVRGIDGPIRAIVDVAVEAIDGGRASRLTINIDFQGHGIGKLLVPLMIRSQAQKGDARQSEALEGTG
jgi:uncharacterized protein YndB with AHSA1/START domain